MTIAINIVSEGASTSTGRFNFWIAIRQTGWIHEIIGSVFGIPVKVVISPTKTDGVSADPPSPARVQVPGPDVVAVRPVLPVA